MCGFAGIYKKDGITEKDKDVIKKMSQCIRHRGPDDSRTVFEENCALAFRRLSMLGRMRFISALASSICANGRASTSRLKTSPR